MLSNQKISEIANGGNKGISILETRIKDLEELLGALLNGQSLKDKDGNPLTVEGVVNDKDSNSIRDELFRARAAEGELRTQELNQIDKFLELLKAEEKSFKMAQPAE